MRKHTNSGIYCILNLTNGKHYIGSSKDLRRRMARHLLMLKRGNHHSRILQNAWSKYGEKNFRIDIVELVEEEKLIEREQFWIDSTLPKYNVYRIAGSSRGYKHTEETRAIFRAAQAVRDPAVNEKISIANTGKIRSKEAIRKYRAIYERKSDAEKESQVALMIAARKGVRVSEAGKQKIAECNRREFIVISPLGEQMTIQNLTAFCKEKGLDRTCMTRVSTGVFSNHKGWVCINPRKQGENNER